MDLASQDLLEAGDLLAAVTDLPMHDRWFIDSTAAVRAAGPDREAVTAAFLTALEQLVAAARTSLPRFDKDLQQAQGAFSRYFVDDDDLVESLAMQPVAAVEYTRSRPALLAPTSNVRVIVDYPLDTETRLVANGAITFYDDTTAERTSRVRDAQLGAQLDHGLGKASIVGPAVVSVAAYYQYQHEAAVLKVDPLKPVPGVVFTDLPPDAKEVFASKGNIFLVQGKLSLTPGGSVKVPISVTWSNRTELIDKPAWRGQVGIAYDVDALVSLLGAR
jgi:hypothetical protein